MRPLRSARGQADPAPSRWAYRMQRLWLTPVFRALVRTGIPSLIVVLLFSLWINDPVRIAAIVDGWRTAVSAVQARPEFMVNVLRIEGASEQLQYDIEEALSVDLPQSQFHLDTAALRTALEQLDPVARAEVRIRAGGVLLLQITEREPAVAWVTDHGIALLDAEGHHVARLISVEEAGGLPLIAGDGADAHVPQALQLIEAAAPVTDRLIGLTRIGGRRWDVTLTGGQRIMLPETAPAAALDRALALHAVTDVLARDVVALDLRLDERPTLRLTAVARQELKRLQDVERLSYTTEAK